LVCEWLVGDTPTELEVRFTEDADGATTVVEIEHRGWERFGEAADERREHNNHGWTGVLRRYASICNAPRNR
jgi:uncharacterized protein YndB with AHSA1/START domain